MSEDSKNFWRVILLCYVTFMTFLILRITEVIAWSWWWIAAPIWIPALLYALALAFVLILYAIYNHK